MRCKFVFAVTLVTVVLGTTATIAAPKNSPQSIAPSPMDSNRTKSAKQNADERLRRFQQFPHMVTLPDLEQLRSAYEKLADSDGLVAVDLEWVRLDYQNARYKVAEERLYRIPPNKQPLLQTKRANLLGFLLLERGEYGQAMTSFNQARVYGASDAVEYAQMHVGLGESSRYLGRYQEAIDFLLRARNNRDFTLYAQAMAAIADIEVEIGQAQLAIAHYTESIDALKRAPQRGLRRTTELAKALPKLARLLSKQGDKSQAERLMTEALQWVQSVGDDRVTYKALTEFGWYYLSTQPKLAREYFELANNAASRSGADAAESYFGLAQYHQQQGAMPQAATAYQQALQHAGQRRDLPVVRLLHEYGKFAFQQGQVQTAVATLTQAINYYEALRPGMSDEFKVTAGDSQIQPYQTLQRAQVAQGDIAGALITTERGRARAFAELLVRRSRRQVKPVTSERRVTPEGEVFTLTVEVDRPPVVPVPTIAEIKQVAKQQKATLVIYSILNDPQTNRQTDLYVWVISPQGDLQFRRIDLRQLNDKLSLTQIAVKSRLIDSVHPSAEVVGELLVAMRGTTTGGIRSAGGSVAAPSPSPLPVRQTANNAYRLLIQPIANLLPQKVDERVIFIPQGALFHVPFHALQDDQGEYLLKRHTLQIAPSVQSLSLIQPRWRTNMNPLIIGNPAPMPDALTPLPGAEQEAKNIGQMLKTQPLIGQAATEATVTKRLAAASLIHLATHGLMDDQNGMDSAVALGPGQGADGLLSAREIFDLRLNADLAVLSACHTGQGKVTGDGVIGLSRSLMSAGVPSVIVSLWAVPDEPTQVLMTEFYRQLQQHGDKSQALRQAMLHTMQQYPNPGDWAGFVLIGSAN
jgi:tetratricopeptide (TPR) repeat protein